MVSNADALILFFCLAIPVGFLAWLSVGRSVILGESYEPNHPVRGGLLAAAIVLLLHFLGFGWALALAVGFGPALGAGTGQWLAGGGSTVIAFWAERQIQRVRAR